MKNILTILVLIMFISACDSSKKESTEVAKKAEDKTMEPIDSQSYPELLQKVFDAHGGLDDWLRYTSLQYALAPNSDEETEEQQLIDLKSRKVLIEGNGFKLGMDGENVWVSPNKAAFAGGSARFYHNLLFYFFGMPFVMSDPGCIYEDMGSKEINGKQYQAIKVSFEEGTGDADDDFYVLNINPETNRLEILLYTVTYGSNEKHENYNAIIYDWQEVGHLIVPKKLTGYKYSDGTIGEKRYEKEFTKVIFNEHAPDEMLFSMPANAEIDRLKN